MNDKEREKRIAELRTLIHIENRIMEGLSRQRGKYFIELCALTEARTIQAEAEIEALEVAA